MICQALKNRTSSAHGHSVGAAGESKREEVKAF